MTTLLAIETATQACSVAVWHDGAAFHLFKVVERAHAECLLPMLRTVAAEADVAFSAVDAVAVGIGPGAFTSLRIGLAAARGLALALARPCLGVTSLEAVADSASAVAVTVTDEGAGCVLVVLDSKRGDLFVQPFSPRGEALVAPTILPAERLAAHLDGIGVGREAAIAVAGDAAAIASSALEAAGYAYRVLEQCRFPTAAAVARLAAARWLAGERPQAPPRPLYLRPADTGPPIVPAVGFGGAARAPG